MTENTGSLTVIDFTEISAGFFIQTDMLCTHLCVDLEMKMDSGCIVCGMQAAGGCMSAHFPNGPYDLELLKKNTTWFGSCCNTATSAGYFLACLQTYDPSTSLHNNIFCTDHGKQTLFNSCGIRQGKVLLYGIYHILKGISETGFSILRIWKVPLGLDLDSDCVCVPFILHIFGF